MAIKTTSTPGHDHFFLGKDHNRNESRVWLVIALTASMMVIEIAAGTYYGSMALVADGWHMSTHAGALLIAALAYRYARRHARDSNFTFGTGKFGDLAGFASAIILALVAILIGWESLLRLLDPVSIGFEQAIAVAVVGLAINLACAWLLRNDHSHHHHGHGHHGHGHHGHHEHADGHAHEAGASGQDNNLRAAYLHVLADALTSVLAIVALVLGRIYGWLWADALMGVVGALVIARWSWTLIRDAGGVLLDTVPQEGNLKSEIRRAVEHNGDHITDLHVWKIGPGHHAAIVALSSTEPKAPSHYKTLLGKIHELSHVTVEVEPSARLAR